nr:hypothetical protein [Trichoderma harzianum]
MTGSLALRLREDAAEVGAYGPACGRAEGGEVFVDGSVEAGEGGGRGCGEDYFFGVGVGGGYEGEEGDEEEGFGE